MEHYKHQEGFDVMISKKAKDGTLVESKIWMGEKEYELRMFIQNNLSVLHKTVIEKLLDLIGEYGFEKYCEGSSDEAMSNDESI